MVERISENRLRYLAGKKNFNLIYLEKDYFLTALLYMIKDVKEIYFKGGTALNKIFLNHTRLSEDLDFSCRGNISEIKSQIIMTLNENRNFFTKYEFDKKSKLFFRIKAFYKSNFSENGYIILDVNKKSKLYLKPEKAYVPHFYEKIPKFKVNILNQKEIFAEKVRSLIMRNRPRDYFDVYMILKRGYKIDYNLVEKKLRDAGEIFEVRRIFKNARKIYSFWSSEVNQLTNEPVKYETVIKELQKEFGYKV